MLPFSTPGTTVVQVAGGADSPACGRRGSAASLYAGAQKSVKTSTARRTSLDTVKPPA